MNSLELKIPPLILVLIIAADMWLLSWIFGTWLGLGWLFSTSPALLWLAIGVGVLLPLLGALEFLKHKTTVNPTKPADSSAVVKTGIYRFTRNPMYLGFFFLLFGFALWLGNFAAAIMLPVYVWFLTRFQIIPEERILLDNFGKPYADYLQTVRRWI
ncbi:isoprenylcysteine carboxylmethyltransferase family protein [Aliidiomarina iranensis]|uniref:Isoprenylcysteine carboxylmethyltransferase family protein n=1 Tax=Aliidiomarina iranensis TaxID=1434071 RepID=A0A432VU07_9GAMM|nr:isoprenylcysteine carboxylmethyltransferase family protein [Aliidiomarina iranensis]RUO19972.1 isoprenylcysteine carboxylmethyltransferase family protein [Aliidiomarina iranensis]